MVSKSIPVLCVLDIESGNISVLEGVPENVSPGQVSNNLACAPRSGGSLLEQLPLAYAYSVGLFTGFLGPWRHRCSVCGLVA